MKFPTLIPATFINRDNRFSASVQLEAGQVAAAHVPTTGRLTGVLRPGCRVWLAPAKGSHRKTSYTLLLSELEHGGLCCVNAIMANQVFHQAVVNGKLAAFPYDQIKKEVRFGHSRLDFRLLYRNVTCWVEVKSVTFAQGDLGMFPDAPTTRGRRHLETLAKLAADGERASAVFIAQRGDTLRFSPFKAVDPEFTETLRHVHDAGVAVHAYRCEVSLEKMEIAQEVPVEL